MNPVPSFYDGSESTSRRQGHHREVVGSGRQGCNLAGESPAISIARFGYVAIPQFVCCDLKSLIILLILESAYCIASSFLPRHASLVTALCEARLIKRLKRHRNELFIFLHYKGVSPYNNHAEQQMRKPVLTIKVSQQNRSQHGAKTQAVLMTLFRSAELQGDNPVETVLSLAKNAIAAKSASAECFKLAA